MMVNEKFRENVPAWEAIEIRKEKFAGFFEKVLDLQDDIGQLSLREQGFYLSFLIHCFQSLEQEFVRSCCLKLTGMQSWFHLNELHRQKLVAANPKLAVVWKKVAKKYKEPKANFARHEKNFMAGLLESFFAKLEELGERPVDGPALDPDELSYLERTVELMIDLLNQLPTRRFFSAVDDGPALCRSLQALQGGPGAAGSASLEPALGNSQ